MGDPDDSRSDPVAAARALQPLVREHADEAQRLRHVPQPVVAAMATAGLYRIAAPAMFGGAEAHPRPTIEAIEAISEADGSIGWVLMIGIETVGIGASLMPTETAGRLFADHPDLVMCGALNPQGRARKVDGGWRVTGRWPFASGCHHADLFWGQCLIESDEADEGADDTNRERAASAATGRWVKRDEATGQPVAIEVLVPRADYEIIDTWNTNGLRGTGSHDVEVVDLFVPNEMTTAVTGGEPNHDGPLYRLPPFSRLAYNKVGVATGIARAAIDHFVALAEGKVPRLSRSSLRDRPRAQLAVAQAEAALRSARAFVFEAVEDEWATVTAGGRCDRRQRALVRLACSHACQEAIRAVELIHAAAGTSPNEADSPLGRARRDVAVVAQQIMVAPHFIDDAGRVLLGLDPLEPIL